jgi:hypothetical protein
MGEDRPSQFCSNHNSRSKISLSEMRSDQIRVREIWYDSCFFQPPRIPRLDALLQDREMFRISHDAPPIWSVLSHDGRVGQGSRLRSTIIAAG